jgi:hypothetical protein
VYRSTDAVNWTRQPDNLLQQPGQGRDDGVIGGHADVVVVGSRAWLFYFTHPGRGNVQGGAGTGTDGPEQRRSSLQVTELIQSGDRLRVERDAPTRIALGD